MSGSNWCFLICIQVSQEVGQVVWYSYLLKNFPQLVVWSTQSKTLAWSVKQRYMFFLELSCFFYDPPDHFGNLISGSSAFSKSSLNIWKFSVYLMLKLCLENFEHYFSGMWNECICEVVWTFFGIALLWGQNKLTFSSPLAPAELSIFTGILSLALSQHYLLGFEIAELKFLHLH